ncbi:TIGR03862 family flavoprotein [Coralliovum pocilloporae]|uniref:TIGR03862 family flavoprotein n=1 Tax=Coralliovum pocilloporae TaxID=3066369 RepID=UPI003306CBE6
MHDPAYQTDIGIVGGGPAGLMAAEHVLASGLSATLYDSMPSLARKLLMAGKSGLNITHSEPLDLFLTRYRDNNDVLKPHIRAFPPSELLSWLETLGIETFTGSSGRIFPDSMKASPFLRAWLQRLMRQGLTYHTRHRFSGWSATEPGRILIKTQDASVETRHKALVLALGGTSWPRLGSTGQWQAFLEEKSIRVTPFRASNCGLNCQWNTHLQDKFAGTPVKSVRLSFGNQSIKGDCILSTYGLEGSAVYPLSNRIVRQIEKTGSPAILEIDLLPDLDEQMLIKRLSKPRGKQSMANFLRKAVKLTSVKTALLHELGDRSRLAKPEELARQIKALPVHIQSPRVIEEAISVSGGISFDELTPDLMLKKLPGVFCAGEMLDWDAPTGGYLLTACFATGRSAGRGAADWVRQNR